MKIAVIVVSDRVSSGVYEDKSGEKIIETLLKLDNSIKIKKIITSDDYHNIVKAIESNLDNDFIITSGGTGFGKRDNTPEATKSVCDKDCLGISEYLRSESIKTTPFASLSRGYAGIKNNTVIVNFPGSVNASEFCATLLYPLMPHIIDMINGGVH